VPARRRNHSQPGLLERVGSAAALEMRRRIPKADLDERDPDYIRDHLPLLWMLSSVYLRAEVRGMENIPEGGPVLLVGNHSGGNMIVDTFAFTLAFETHFGVERPFYQLAHNLVLLLGPFMPWIPNLRKFGTIPAGHANAEKALDAGAAVLVYPGGDYETHRPSWESAKVDFNGRNGFSRLALRNDVPIVPVVSIGGQETALFLSRGEGLARLLHLDRMFRLKVLPISLALPWGINIGDMLTHFPLPAKITTEVLPQVHLREEYGPKPDIDAVYNDVLARMQRSLTDLASERRLPVLG
jgi:1-acyl-sn-glycerol-3-phosphate acyltransferase